MAIAFDAIAAWRLREHGWEPEEWMSRLRLHQESRDETSGLGTASWRLLPDAGPAGRWFSTLTVTVREDGEGWTTMDNMPLRGAIYLSPGAGDPKGPAGLLAEMQLPDTVIAALPGRPVGDLVDLPPVALQPILSAHIAAPLPGSTAQRVNIAFATSWERCETPFFLLP